MSDSAFKSAPYSGYTSTELVQMSQVCTDIERRDVMISEIKRRIKVANGDWSVMTDIERLRHAQKTGRTRAGNSIC